MNILFQWIILFLVIGSGLILILDSLFFKKGRMKRVRAEHPDFDSYTKKGRQELIKAPYIGDLGRSLFIVFLIVFILRQFIFGLFIVPTGSMLPTIQLNDVIYVNKLAYSIHLPFMKKPILTLGQPHRGDIIVCHYPVNPNIDYIKTVVGVPGDIINYQNHKLTINGHSIPEKFMGHQIEPTNANIGSTGVSVYKETLGNTVHTIYNAAGHVLGSKLNQGSTAFYHLKIPKGEYFVMGDNRDNSDDSRFWGFVNQSELVGKAEWVLVSWDSQTHSPRWHRFFKDLYQIKS